MRVGLLHPGEMGAAVGAQLVERGHTVLWLPAGRSEATVRRASAAGLVPATTLAGVELVLSICPPHAALELARDATSEPGGDGLFLDANAVAPATAAQIGAVVRQRWVDGGIVGPPPVRAGTTRLYLSGPHAADVAPVFAGTAIEAVVLDGSPVAASALKLTYAAWTKGTIALLLTIRAAARAHGVDDALLEEWARSQPGLAERAEAAADAAARKGWRWSGEMDEIAATLAASGQPAGFHQAAADVYRRLPADLEPTLDAVLALLRGGRRLS